MGHQVRLRSRPSFPACHPGQDDQPVRGSAHLGARSDARRWARAWQPRVSPSMGAPGATPESPKQDPIIWPTGSQSLNIRRSAPETCRAIRPQACSPVLCGRVREPRRRASPSRQSTNTRCQVNEAPNELLNRTGTVAGRIQREDGPDGTPQSVSPEVRECAARMVQEHSGEYPSQRAAIEALAPKLGCATESLRRS